MNKKLFAELLESMRQMNEIARGERAPSREFHMDALSVKARAGRWGSFVHNSTISTSR